jgi:outer membrane protein OmpA-like peptidoglycan-associated protein
MSSLENGKWSEPKSLGSAVNTSGAEMFPYYYKGEDGTTRLYFSSDAREGMGGLDLYYTEQGPDGRWNAPVHMGAPFNSSKDDFGIIMTNSHAGYFASSRNGNGDVDQMFAFDKAPINLFVDGSVLNKNTRNNIINAQIVMLNKTTGKSQMLSSSQDGKFFAALDGNSEYSFNATHPRYLPGNAMATTFGKTVSETLQVQIFMDSTGYVLSLANIYYDFDNWNIRPDAAAQLDKLVPILLEHPEVTLALDAHADSRGSQQYNVELTKRRAQSVITYLYARGIDRKRLEAKWYGKSRPVNECKSGVACSPVKHQQNRRSEFKLVEDGKIIEGEWSGYKIQK